MIEPSVHTFNFSIPVSSYEYLGSFLTVEAVRVILSIIFFIVFVVFIVVLVTTSYHLRRYSLTKAYAIKAEVLYLVIAFIPLLVMLGILLSY